MAELKLPRRKQAILLDRRSGHRVLMGLVAACFIMGFMASAEAFMLVTPEDVVRERSKGVKPRFRGLGGMGSGAPRIQVVLPEHMKNIASPLDIELRFIATPPAKIVRDSLTVLYGFFGFNITNRLTKHAQITSRGIVAKGAELPAGSHSLTIRIADDRDRVGSTTLHFDVRDR